MEILDVETVTVIVPAGTKAAFAAAMRRAQGGRVITPEAFCEGILTIFPRMADSPIMPVLTEMLIPLAEELCPSSLGQSVSSA